MPKSWSAQANKKAASFFVFGSVCRSSSGHCRPTNFKLLEREREREQINAQKTGCPNPQANCISQTVKLVKRETQLPPQNRLSISWLGEAKTASKARSEASQALATAQIQKRLQSRQQLFVRRGDSIQDALNNHSCYSKKYTR